MVHSYKLPSERNVLLADQLEQVALHSITTMYMLYILYIHRLHKRLTKCFRCHDRITVENARYFYYLV
jgi:hypothetical protein